MYTIKQISGYIDLQRVNQTCIQNSEDVFSLILSHLVTIHHYAQLWSYR